MIEINKLTLGIAAGLASTLFIGYCVYFDKKRRSYPDYKKKLRERRRRNRQNATTTNSDIPNLSNHKALESYFIQEIHLGESLIARGQFESGVEHLANSIVVCGQPTELLHILQTTLPSQVFAMLILKIQAIGNRSKSDNFDEPKILSAEGSAGMAMGINSIEPIIIDDIE